MEPGGDPFKFMMEVDRLAADLHRLGEQIRNRTEKGRDYCVWPVC